MEKIETEKRRFSKPLWRRGEREDG